MKYFEFKNNIRRFPVFSTSQLSVLSNKTQILKNQLTRWQKNGLVIKLKKGLYILNEDDRKISPSRLYIANQLYSPSYISTEYALSFYDLIPERVEDVTSVTTNKTAVFKNLFGTFRYQHIKEVCFFGFLQQKDEEGLTFFIAEPEKAIVDFFYLNMNVFRNCKMDIFRESYRFQNYSKLDFKKLRLYTRRFDNIPLLKTVNLFIGFLKTTE